MPDHISTESTDPLPQPSSDQPLARIESAIAELLAGQRIVLSELEIIKEDAKSDMLI